MHRRTLTNTLTGILLALVSLFPGCVMGEDIRITNGKWPPFTFRAAAREQGLVRRAWYKSHRRGRSSTHFFVFPGEVPPPGCARVWRACNISASSSLNQQQNLIGKRYWRGSTQTLPRARTLPVRLEDDRRPQGLEGRQHGRLFVRRRVGQGGRGRQAEGRASDRRTSRTSANCCCAALTSSPWRSTWPTICCARSSRPEEAASIVQHPRLLMQTPICLALSRKSERSAALIARFNRGLQRLTESGAHARYIQELHAGNKR